MSEHLGSENGTWSGYTQPSPPTHRRNLVSVDRPVWITMVKLCQLLNPSDYIHLNHALSIGSVIPSLPIDSDQVEQLNKMIELIWGLDAVLAIPLVISGRNRGAQGSSLSAPKYPVPGLKVCTQQVSVDNEDLIDRVVGGIKAEYKFQDPIECIEAGSELVLSSILGNLITKPHKPSLSARSKTLHDPLTEAQRTHRGRSTSNHGMSSRRSNSVRTHKQHKAASHDRSDSPLSGHTRTGVWGKVKRALMS